jgi:ribosome-associated toxin RatA of RatAB toxin-antitoxin module
VKELTGRASATTTASAEECLALLEAVDRYPNWYPEVVKSVEVLERDDQGRPSQVRSKLHVERGPLTHDFDLRMEVKLYPPGAVRLSRIPHHGRDGEKFDVNWFVRETQPTQIQLNLAATLDVPRFLPLGGIGDSMAQGFVSAATRALAPPP